MRSSATWNRSAITRLTRSRRSSILCLPSLADDQVCRTVCCGKNILIVPLAVEPVALVELANLNPLASCAEAARAEGTRPPVDVRGRRCHYDAKYRSDGATPPRLSQAKHSQNCNQAPLGVVFPLPTAGRSSVQASVSPFFPRLVACVAPIPLPRFGGGSRRSGKLESVC